VKRVIVSVLCLVWLSSGAFAQVGSGVPTVDNQMMLTMAQKALATGQSGHDAGQEYLEKGKAAEKRKDYSEAMEWLRKAADQGNTDAQVRIGVHYVRGLGVPKDYGEAMRWYRKAADQGNALAQYNIGELYENGLGVPKDYGEAMQWYRKAADQGNAVAQNNIGQLYERGQGVTQDYGEAMRWYHKAADQGNAAAQSNIGTLYYNGWGVTQDYDEAMRWYHKAADQGNAVAEYSIGLLYDQGQGVPADMTEARQWYAKAATQGFKEASDALEQMNHPQAAPTAGGTNVTHEAIANSLPRIGNPKASVTVVEFFDYNCPYSKKMQPLLTRLVDEDKNVVIFFREFPILKVDSVLASKAALAIYRIDSTKYFAFHTALMQSAGTFDEAMLVRTAKTLGVDTVAFKDEIKTPEITHILDTNRELGQKLGVSGTPAFFINGYMLPGALSYEQLKTLVDNNANCVGNDPDARIEGCTALIDSGKATEENLQAAYLKRGRAYGNKKLFAKAIADFDTAIKLNPQYGEAYYYRGKAKEAAGDTSGGDADLAQAKVIGFTGGH